MHDPFHDSRNEGRQRRGRASLEELDRTLRELEERLRDAGRGPDRDMRARRDRPADRETGEQDRRTALDGELLRLQERSADAIETMAAEVRRLRGDLARIAEKAEGSDVHAAIARLKEEIHTLVRQGEDHGAEQLRREMEELRRALSADRRLAAREGEGQAASLAGLVDRMEAIGRTLEKLPDTFPLHSMEEKLRLLARSMEQFARSRGAAAPGSLEMIEGRLDEISRAIVASTVTMHTLAPDTDTFDRIEARIGALAKKVEALAGANEGPRILARLGELAERVERIAASASSDSVAHLGAQIAALTRRLDEGATGWDEPRMREFEDRLDAVLARLAEAGATQDHATFLDAVDRRFDALASYLESQPPVDPEALRRLSTQIRDLGEMLSQVVLDPADSRLRQIEDAIGNSRSQMVAVAREAAERALSAIPEQDRGSEATAALSAELRKLSELARRSEERNARTVEAIHDTLMKICARLSALNATEMPALPANDPQPRELRPEPVRPPAYASDPEEAVGRARSEGEPFAATSSADFIAAARRAAQAAGAGSGGGEPAVVAATSVFGARFRNRKAMIAAASIVLVGLIGLQIHVLRGSGEAEVASREPAMIQSQQASLPAPVSGHAAKRSPDGAEAGAEPPLQLVDREETVAAIAPTATIPAPASIEIGGVPEDAGPPALREAAAAGDLKAIFEIGMRYGEGRGAPLNLKASASWIERAAEMGYAPAQYRIGNYYEKGLGVGRDPARAMVWYQLAAEQGNAGAMHNLAVLFALGANGEPDHESAARWFLDAAELDVRDSQYNLGILAARGVGIARDLIQAYKWFALAARSGDKDAVAKRDEIAASLSEEQLARARSDVELWKARPADPAANLVEIPREWSDEAGLDMQQAIANVQKILVRNGYDAGPPDGVLGERTRDAIRRFQRDNGLAATGEIDPALIEELLARK